MPLVPPIPPDTAYTTLAAGVADALALRAAFNNVGGRTVGQVRVAAPHPGYTVSAARLADGRSVPKRLGCWLFLVDHRRSWLTASTTAGGRNGRVRFLSLADRPDDWFLKVLDAAERLTAVRSGRYEVRRLTCAVAQLEAAWLKDLEGHADLWFDRNDAVIRPTPEAALLARWRVVACRQMLAAAEHAAERQVRDADANVT